MGMYDRDHPRVCGEKQLAVVVLSLTHRITPAYAGKRELGLDRLPPLWDHPRVCGEKTKKIP